MIKVKDINGVLVEHKKFNFPCGEMQVEIPIEINEGKFNLPSKYADIEFYFEKNEDIIELMMLVDALKRMRVELNNLWMPYIPFARQDRTNKFGEAFSLKVFCDIVNGFGFSRVVVHDPHSDVATALINNVQVIQQYQIWEERKTLFKDAWLVAPDAGALKKIYKVAERVPCKGVILASKKRDLKTGEILETTIHHKVEKEGDTYIMIDDICDGGRTFIELAKVLRQYAGKTVLCVTHGFFTKGLEVFDGLIDEIYTLKGRVK